MPELKPIRHVIVGAAAGVWSMHKYCLGLDTTEIVGVTDLNHEKGRQRADELHCPFFPDYETMLNETQPDVAVIITPHTTHAALALAAFKAGCHVLVEKPIAVQVAESDAMIAAAEKAGKLLAVSFQQRTRPEIVAAKKLINEGRLGKIQHVDVQMTWTRAVGYFTSAPWRGTWKGEAGGVLMNQGAHELDLMVHLIGMPTRVFGWVRTTVHAIETEDTAQAMCEWSNGALGSIHLTTAEAGQPQRIEIIGTGGRLTIRHGGLEFKRFETDVIEFIKTSPKIWDAPAMIDETVELPQGLSGHEAIYRNFHSAIQNGTPLFADGRSAAFGLELSNAIVYSSYTNCPVEFPLDRQAYANLLAEMQAKVS